MAYNPEVQQRLSDRIGSVNTEIVLRKALDARKIVNDALLTDPDGVTYDEFTHGILDKEYVFKPQHVTIDMVSDHGSSSCRDCNGKGYKVVEIAKGSLKNPADHVILSRKPIDGLEGAEKEAAIEAERKHARWRVLLPCECAVKALHKYDPNFYASQDRAIMFKLVYEEKAKS